MRRQPRRPSASRAHGRPLLEAPARRDVCNPHCPRASSSRPAPESRSGDGEPPGQGDRGDRCRRRWRVGRRESLGRLPDRSDDEPRRGENPYRATSGPFRRRQACPGRGLRLRCRLLDSRRRSHGGAGARPDRPAAQPGGIDNATSVGSAGVALAIAGNHVSAVGLPQILPHSGEKTCKAAC